MNRKRFISQTLSATAIPVLLNGLPVRMFGQANFWPITEGIGTSDRVLVLIQLDGGNDGLNTIIPIDQYKNLTNARANIIVPEKKVLPLCNSSITGLHPSMIELGDLYKNGQLSIIQGVSYPKPNYSHFRATDIWLTGSDAKTALNTGWAGRFLNQQFPNYPSGFPNPKFPDPPAIQIGSVLSKIFQGQTVGMSMAIGNTSNFYDMVLGNYHTAPSTIGGQELDFIRTSASETKLYTAVVKKAALAQQNLSKMYPEQSENSIADQLKIAAQLIGGGLKTKIYLVTIDGFDTHGAQVNPTDTTTGKHAKLLEKLSKAIAAFQDDLHLMGKQDQVMGMVFSEFGRRIKSNNSYGTDHGSSGPVLLFGSKIKGGILGQNPEISANVQPNDNLPMQHDYRSIYTSILKNWFNLAYENVNEVTLSPFPVLDLFKN